MPPAAWPCSTPPGGGSNGLAHDGRYLLLTRRLETRLRDAAARDQSCLDRRPVPATAVAKAPSPVLRPDDPGARWFETDTLFKSYIFRDDSRTLGAPFVMFYNARAPKESERIGIAVSQDLRSWQRHGDAHVLENRPPDGAKHNGISGDPQIVRMGELWGDVLLRRVLEAGGAFDTFAALRDLVHWTKWKARI